MVEQGGELHLLIVPCRHGWAARVSEVSRFSCLKFLGVPGVFDYAGPSGDSRYRLRSCCLPRITRASASGLHLFEARSPTPPIPCLRFTVSLTVAAQDSGPRRIATPFL